MRWESAVTDVLNCTCHCTFILLPTRISFSVPDSPAVDLIPLAWYLWNQKAPEVSPARPWISQPTRSKCTPEPCIKIAPQPVAQWAWGLGRGLACASAGLGEHVRLIYVTCGPPWPLFVGKPVEPSPMAGVHLFSGLKYPSSRWAGAMPAAPGSLITIQIRSVSSG